MYGRSGRHNSHQSTLRPSSRNYSSESSDDVRGVTSDSPAERVRLAREEETENKRMDLESRPKWQHPKTNGAVEPSDMTVTNINQAWDLFRPEAIESMAAQYQKSSEWLKTHSIEYMKLLLKHLVNKGQILRPDTNKETGKMQQRMEFDLNDLTEFEYKINGAIQLYTARIKWFLQGSRKIFGMVKGKNVGVIVDASEANFGVGRRSTLQQALLHLIDEQLSIKRRLYFVSYGTKVNPLWDEPRVVNGSLIEEAKQWVVNLESQGGTNLLDAMKHIYTIEGIQTILLILGSLPDQDLNVLYDYIEQLNCGRDVRIFAISYDCSDHLTNVMLMKLAETSDGNYHCSNSTSEDQLYTSFDVSVLLDEIKKAQDILNKIRTMKEGHLGTALVSTMNQISQEVAKLPQSRFLPRPPGHDLPLCIETPSFNPYSSSDWLAKNGLKAKGLDLYQVLAPNAYSFREEFIPVIRKTVQSQVHSKVMAQFPWHDGTLKNIHVDMSMLFEYQKRLGAIVKLFEKRIDWLSTSSRRIFGTVTEKNVLLLIDLSLSNVKYMVHVQNSLRLLLEQQMSNKDYFNIIGCGEEVKMWKPTLVQPTGDLLQQAWRWILNLNAGGSRNIMEGLRKALENDDQARHNIEVEGIYLFISGVPDQSPDLLNSYLEEASAGRRLKLHVVLFNVDDYDVNGAIPGRYANIAKTAEILRSMAHCTGGRFQWLRETGIIESDDVMIVTHEIEKALNFSRKCAMLVDSVKKKYSLEEEESRLKLEDASDLLLPPGTVLRALPPPKQTALSQARKELACEKDKETAAVPKALAYKDGQIYRDSSTKKRPDSAKDPMQRVKSGKKTEQAYFYTGNKNDVGAVFRKYPTTKPKCRGVKKIHILDKEEQITTREWMRMYSFSKMRLNLDRLVSGSECHHIGHATERVKILGKTVEAKTCNIFPTINVSGTLRHLLLSPQELFEFEQQAEYALNRYVKRLQWLLSSSRRVFGTVSEKKCIFLIDTSGSMDERMEELKKELISLIWEQLHKHKIRFNLVRFSKTCERWKPSLVEPSDDHCHDAIRWVAELVAHGNTCTLETLQMAFEECDLEAIYLLTDGKPDTSTSMVLQEVQNLNADNRVIINTISFNCTDSIANGFLQTLARENRGRYHSVVQESFDAQLFGHQLVEGGFKNPEHPQMPEFDGDDLKRLALEINKGRRYIAQSRTYRIMYEALRKVNDEPSGAPHDCLSVGPNAKHRP